MNGALTANEGGFFTLLIVISRGVLSGVDGRVTLRVFDEERVHDGEQVTVGSGITVDGKTITSNPAASMAEGWVMVTL